MTKKIIKYTLTPEGTVPDYVIDGGYFASKNNNNSPQDYDIIGIATDTATEESFADEAALLVYLQDNNFTFKNPHTEVVTPSEDVVSDMWSKLNNN
jgi:hypothetical protein